MVKENEYHYFLYDVTCDDCTLVVGIQSLSGGNPDLYINYGEESLPDKHKHDFESAGDASEALFLTP